ncbi:putative disease resistance protein [Hibiscus syriacus]|uniref:non-specific serine/threonine protein kinase n=1 Tax=Hibiscus syriacus TaxID=106335 RepID=A0A6A2ZG30_HIBSY|nr:putative disease resistance protein [Hibiscus syriacus]
MVNRGVFTAVGRQMGVGKESHIFEVASEDGTVMAMKLHRLVLNKFAKCCHNCIKTLGFIFIIVQVKKLQNPETVFETIIGLAVRLAEHGLIHCDFNEFNIMIDDDEKVTMIDFPQMVSVSHRNAQMLNLSFEERSDDIDNSDVDPDESSRPSFSSIAKTAGFLDKELAACGFTRKDEDEIQKFIEGDVEEDDVSRSEHDSELYQTNIKEEPTSGCNEEDQVDENLQSSEAGQSGDPEGRYSSNEEEDDEQKGEEDDTELVKSFAKQRRRAMAAARKGHKNTASRNSYKDKGGPLPRTY